MRSVQRGISATFLVVAILTIAVALTAGYFTFYIDAKKTGKLSSYEINSFEECAKLYPVMESYPEQCNTPDGKHFVRELSEEEKDKIITSALSPATNMPSPSPNLDGQVWNDIHQRVVLVNLYYSKYLRLPESIEAIGADPEFEYFKSGNNPIDGKPYLYRIGSESKSFEISGIQSDGTLYKQVIEID